ncbi:MAG: universal stress protein [Deinococcales bacterium]
MYLNILVPIDSSPCSENAVHLAVRLARAWGSHLSLVHVLTDTLPEHRATAQALLERHAACARHRPRLLLEQFEQSVAYTLAKLAERESAELIVIGTHAHAKLERQAIGSVAHELAVLAQTPVLIVPAHFRKYGFEARWAHVAPGGL